MLLSRDEFSEPIFAADRKYARAACSREQKFHDSTSMNTAEERKLLGILLEFRGTTSARR